MAGPTHKRVRTAQIRLSGLQTEGQTDRHEVKEMGKKGDVCKNGVVMNALKLHCIYFIKLSKNKKKYFIKTKVTPFKLLLYTLYILETLVVDF